MQLYSTQKQSYTTIYIYFIDIYIHNWLLIFNTVKI